jgi:UDP-N-acetylmuramate dehydrogenase
LKIDHSVLKIQNTFGIEASCRRYLEYATTDEAVSVAQDLRREASRFLIVGAGSNLLPTSDFDGTVVHSAVRGISLMEQPDGSALLRCGSGETWDDVVAWTVDRGFADLANLSLIPGEVGASAVQNIGAYGAEACQFIHDIRAVDITTGQSVVIPNADCHYGYRDSLFKHEWKDRFLITHVSYKLNRKSVLNLEYGHLRAECQRLGISSPTPQQLRQVVIDIRRSKLPDPSEQGNAGSFFMNPVVSRAKYEELAAAFSQIPHYYINKDSEKIPAAWLIDQCGWKGRSIGRAGVHHKQALVLVNLGGATGQDIMTLCHAIQDNVQQRFGITLKPEVNIV